MNSTCSGIKIILASLTVGWMCWNSVTPLEAQTTPANISPDLQQVIKLSQSHMSDDIIVNFIKSSGKAYSMGADDIIYLNSQGVSQGVISALQTTTSQAAAPVPATAVPAPATVVTAAAMPEPPPLGADDAATPATPAAPVATTAPAPKRLTLDFFREQLGPYGDWQDTANGPVWKPNVEAGWRPYYDAGSWTSTDAGWYWQSDYTWGDIPFHYGRWSFSRDLGGWIWTPGFTFAPAWVCWRHADDDGYCGWAPLPPGTVFVNGGWQFHGAAVADDFDFGLTEGYFVFVDYGHFWEHDFRQWIVPRDRRALLFRRSVFANHYRVDHGHMINEGLDRDRMAQLTGREIHVESERTVRTQEVHARVIQRQNDRVTLKSGGKIEPAHRMENPAARGDAPRETAVNHGGEDRRSNGSPSPMSGNERNDSATKSGGWGNSTDRTPANSNQGHLGNASGNEPSERSNNGGLSPQSENRNMPPQTSGSTPSTVKSSSAPKPANPPANTKKKPNS